MQEANILFPVTVYLYRRNRRGTSNSLREGIHRIQTDATSRNTGREYHLPVKPIPATKKGGKGRMIPHILRGASSSRRMG